MLVLGGQHEHGAAQLPLGGWGTSKGAPKFGSPMIGSMKQLPPAGGKMLLWLRGTETPGMGRVHEVRPHLLFSLSKSKIQKKKNHPNPSARVEVPWSGPGN